MIVLITLAALGLQAVIERFRRAESRPNIVAEPLPNIIRGFWSSDLDRRHRFAAPNCDAARAVGLAPSRRGEPGYYPWHDADNDGIACEPLPTWRMGLRGEPAPAVPSTQPADAYPRIIYPSR